MANKTQKQRQLSEHIRVLDSKQEIIIRFSFPIEILRIGMVSPYSYRPKWAV